MTAITEVDPVGSDGVSSYGLGTVLVTQPHSLNPMLLAPCVRRSRPQQGG